MKFRYPVYDPLADFIGVQSEFGWPCNRTQDLDTVLACPFKIALVPTFFNSNDQWPGINLPKKTIDLSQFDLVLFRDIESRIWSMTREWIKSTGVNNYLLVAGSHQPDSPKQHTLFNPYWLMRTLHVNPGYAIDQPGQKPYVFEAMMGARRPHRDYIMLAMTRSGLLQHSVVNYRGFPGGYANSHSEEFQNIFLDTELKFPYISSNYDPTWEPVSDIANNTINFPIPSGLYQRTHYSIVPETNYTGRGFFPTEKTTKILLTQRACIWFAPENFLQNLRNMGFETFGDVIDESYDTDDYHRDWKRFERAWHSAEQLARFEDPASVYQKLRPRLEHNRNHMLTLEQRSIAEWQQRMQELIPAQHWSV